MSAATPDPKHIPSFSFMTLTSDYLHFFFMAGTEGMFCRDVLTQFVINKDLLKNIKPLAQDMEDVYVTCGTLRLLLLNS